MSHDPIQQGSSLRLYATVKNHKGDLVPLQAYTTLQIRLKHPRTGVTTPYNATVVGDGSTARMYYDFLPANIDDDGIWEHQGYVLFDDGKEYYSKIKTFKVKENL